jgi:hypothetical protein
VRFGWHFFTPNVVLFHPQRILLLCLTVACRVASFQRQFRMLPFSFRARLFAPYGAVPPTAMPCDSDRDGLATGRIMQATLPLRR